MSLDSEIQAALRELVKRKVSTFVAEVVSVNKQKGTCVVKDDTIQYSDVRLCAVLNTNGSKFYIYPKPNSTVIVSPINEDMKSLYIEEYSEVEEVTIEIGVSKFSFNQNGFLIKRNTETLAGLIDDLFIAITSMSFATPSGATTALVNLSVFQALKTRFQTLLKTT